MRKKKKELIINQMNNRSSNQNSNRNFLLETDDDILAEVEFKIKINIFEDEEEERVGQDEK